LIPELGVSSQRHATPVTMNEIASGNMKMVRKRPSK